VLVDNLEKIISQLLFVTILGLLLDFFTNANRQLVEPIASAPIKLDSEFVTIEVVAFNAVKLVSPSTIKLELSNPPDELCKIPNPKDDNVRLPADVIAPSAISPEAPRLTIAFAVFVVDTTVANLI
jgi:hypothetical protein